MKFKNLFILIFLLVGIMVIDLKSEPTWGQHYYMGITDDIDAITGDTQYILDNSTKKLVFRFTVTNSSSITVGRIRLRVKSADDAHIRIETVSVGNPTGTLVDANAEVDYTANSSYISFPGTFTLNGNTDYAIVITRAATATTTKVQVSDSGSGAFVNNSYANGTPIGNLAVLFSSDGSTYSEVANVYPVFALRQSSGTPDPIMGTPFNFGTSGWTTNSLGVGEVFECPSGGLSLSGLYIALKRKGSPSQIPEVIIEQLSGNDIASATVSARLLKGPMGSTINDKKWWFLSFPTNINLTAGNNYVVKVVVNNYDPTTDCIIIPAGGEWYNYANIVTPPSDTAGTYVRSGYAITWTNNWGPLHTDSSGRYDSDLIFKFRLNKGNGTLPVVTLVSPTNDATVNTSTPSLIWNTVSGADFYEVFISTNNSSYSNWIKTYTTVSTQVTVDIALRTNTFYYWHIRAVQTNTGYNRISEKRRFKVNISESLEIGTYSDPVSITNEGLYWGQMYVMNPADTLTAIKLEDADPNANNYKLDNANEKIAFLFAVTNQVSVNRMRIRLENEGADYGVKIRIETVSNGIPTGKLAATNSFILNFATNNWAYFYNNSVITFSNDKVYAIVISKAGINGNEIQVSDFPNNSANDYFWNGTKPNKLNVLYTADGTNYTTLDVYPIFAMRPASGYPVPNLGTPFNFGSSVWTTNSLGVGEVFSPGGNIVISGISFYAKRRGTSPQYVKVKLSEITNNDSPDREVKVFLEGQIKQLVNDKKWYNISFGSNITLQGGKNYSVKFYVDSYDANDNCIIFPVGVEWWNYVNVVPSGYAITLTNGNWGVYRSSSKDSDFVFKFRVVRNTLGSVTLVSPDTGIIITNDTTPTFSWNNFSGITHYELFVSEDSNINFNFKYYNVGTSLSYEIPDTLTKTNIYYYWRIMAVNSNTGAIALSEVRRFKIHLTEDFLNQSSSTGSEVREVSLKYYGISEPYPNILDSNLDELITIYFKSDEAGEVSLELYNIYGKKVMDLKKMNVSENNTYKIELSSKELGLKRGIYFIVMKTPVSVSKRKIFVK